MLLTRRALLLLAIAGTARADTIPTGSVAHVTRERSRDSVHMVFVQPERDVTGQIALLGVNGPIEVGEEYSVVDEAGFATLVRVINVKKTDEKCPGYPYLVANARVLAGGRHPNTMANKAVALGPVRSADTAAKLMNKEDQPPGGAPPPGFTPSLMYMVDRDGDGVPDLARYLFDCAAGPRQPWQGAATLCIEDFGRDHGTWRSLGRVQFGCR